MLQLLVANRLDCVFFALIVAIGALLTNAWLRKHGNGSLSWSAWMLLILTVGGGSVMTQIAADHERVRLREMLAGIAPTYAAEIERLGHSQLDSDTAPNDPTYLSIINAELRWLKTNPLVSDIYTFRATSDGKVIYIADAEHDYDHDGKFESAHEGRTPIGLEFPNPTYNMRRALEGISVFDADPVTDQYGTWVSSYVPVRDENGDIDGAIGVDYDASNWLTSIAWARASMLGCAAVIAVVLISSSAFVSISRTELEQRRKLEEQLLDASRRAGMAEIATGVLHNVGNVLNSVNVSAATVSEKLRNSKVPSLGKAVNLMKQREADLGTYLTQDEKGKQLPLFLGQLADFMASERNSMIEEMSLLERSIEHIKGIVSAQQTYARRAPSEETFDLVTICDEAIRLDIASLDRHCIEIERRFNNCPQVKGDRHKVLQIVVNLMSNARKAVQIPDLTSKKIIIELNTVEHAGAAHAQLRVIDNGIGITPAIMPKIFNHGFTTRGDGHGFGLHASANAARAMGGSLVAASEGANKGATFTLELPLLSVIAPVTEPIVDASKSPNEIAAPSPSGSNS